MERDVKTVIFCSMVKLPVVFVALLCTQFYVNGAAAQSSGWALLPLAIQTQQPGKQHHISYAS